jgi:hypothetical protein
VSLVTTRVADPFPSDGVRSMPSKTAMWAAVAAAGWSAAVAPGQKPPGVASSKVVVTDKLDGSTAGKQSRGKFVAGGWTPAGPDDRILWEFPKPVKEGCLEASVTNLDPRRPVEARRKEHLRRDGVRQRGFQATERGVLAARRLRRQPGGGEGAVCRRPAVVVPELHQPQR